MIDLILKYIPLPYTDNAYEYAVITEQISRKIVTIAHIPTTLVALALAYYLYKNTKNLSSFYLLLLTIAFTLWGYFDLIAWTANTRSMYFGWSLSPIAGTVIAFLSYWFLYAFAKGKDLPSWQKITCILTLTPLYYSALTNSYLGDYYNHAITPVESDWVLNYLDVVNITFLMIIAVFTFVMYRKEDDERQRGQTLYAGLGVFTMLFIFTSSQAVANILFDLNFLVGDAANASLYALFGIPIMVGFLGYLVAKHGAFGMRVLKSVGLVIIMMIILFVNIFI